MNNGLKTLMAQKNYSSLSEMKGLMSYSKIKNPSLCELAQFMKYFSDFKAGGNKPGSGLG